MIELFCVECDVNIEAVLVKGDIVYSHRKDLHSLDFYLCKVCKNHVGCHKGTLNPLGVIANKALKQKRIEIHLLIDPIWKNKKVTRKNIYKMISEKIGKNYHTAEIVSVKEAEKIINIINKLFYD